MIHTRPLILRLRKLIMGLFVLICFCKTSYAIETFETAVGLILKSQLPQSSFSGLTARSLSRWHIKSCLFHDKTLGIYQGEDILLELNLWPLILGKIHLDKVIIEELCIKQDPNLPFDPQIFNRIYQNKTCQIQKLTINHLHIPQFNETLNLHFYKKDFLNFCTLHDSCFKNRAHFEILRKSSFLKFKSNLQLDLPHLGIVNATGDGFINHSSACHLQGLSKLNYCNQALPFELDLKFDQTLHCQGLIKAKALEAQFNYEQNFLNAHVAINDLKTLFPLSHLHGEMDLKIHGSLNNLELVGASEKLYFKRKALAPCQLLIPSIDYHQTQLQAWFLNQTPQAFNLNLLVSNQGVDQTIDLSTQGPSLQAVVSLEKTDQSLSKVSIQAHLQQAHMFEGFFDQMPLQGRGDLILNFSKQDQLLEILGSCHNMTLGAYQFDEASICYQNSPSRGTCILDLKALQNPYFAPINFSVKGDKQNQWSFLTHLNSCFFDLVASHELYFLNDKMHWDILDLNGHYLDKPVKLTHPMLIQYSQNERSMAPFELLLGDSVIKGGLNQHNDTIKSTLCIESMDLKGFKVPYFQAPLEGTLSCNIQLDSDNRAVSQAQLSVDSLVIRQKGANFPPLFIKGEAYLLDDELARYSLNTYFSNDDYCFSQGVIPFGSSKKQPYHQLALKFKLNDLGQLINLGSNSLGGQLRAELTMNKAPSGYLTTGLIDVNNLHASFPFLGIYLDQGHLSLQPNGKKAPFHITVQDLTYGQAEGSGTLNLSDFSYNASVTLNKLFLNFKTLFQSHLSGPLNIEGDFHKLTASGTVDLSDGTYSIDHPSLKKTKSYKIERSGQDLPKKTLNPFEYNLNLQASSNDLRIQGIGLESSWQGRSECLIKNNLFSLDGLLECQKGEVRFQTKKIILDQGLIHFTHHNPSTISAKGHIDSPSHQIKVSLIGPLKEPKIQLSSLPALSESSIISYILFNKPLSELHPFQSIELAQTLLELSGHQTPFSLSKLRSHLNVDALDIKTSEHDNKSLTLYVGKYITPELLIGLFQTRKTSDLLVQLELKHGFLLKAESKEQKEGKFSLKWNKNF